MWPSLIAALLVVDNDDHPHPDLALVADQRRTMNPFILALLIAPANPSNFCRNAPAFSECCGELFLDTIGSPDFIQER